MAAPWEKYANPANRYGADPVKVREQELKEESNRRANDAADRAAAAAERANSNSANANALAQSRFQMELAAKGLMIGPDGQIVARPGGPVGGKPPVDPARIGKLNSLIEQINRTQELYNQGPGTTSGVAGLTDYFPSDANVAFDTSGAQLSEKGLAAFRIPGSGTMTDRDAAMFERANMPTASTRDVGIEEQLRGIRSRVDEELNALGLPAANWVIGTPGKKKEERDTTPALRAGGGGPDFGNTEPDPTGFVPYGSTMRRENNPQWKGVNEAVKGMIVAGQSPEQISAYLQGKGISTEALSGVNQAIDYYRRTGKKDFRVNVDDIEVPMSGFEQFRNNAPQTAVGTGAAAFLNAGGFGVPQALAGDQLQYLRDQNWKSALVGDVAGIIGATSGISKAGSSLSRSLMPSLLTGGGRTGNAIRAVAPDAAYGTIYGGVTEGDPLTGAVTAAVGSGGGQLLGKGLQKTFTGVTDPAVQYLTQRGIPLSLGETLGNNSIIGRQMQRMESIPVLGDLMSARRGEARDAVYRATLEDAVAPSGQQITGQGVDALASAQAIKNQAYTDAYGGINAPIDAQYVSEVAPFIRTGRNIYGDTGGEFGAVVKDDLAPLFGPNRALDGTSAQQFGQTVNDFASDFSSRGAYGNKAAMQLRGIGEATEGLVERTNPGAVPMIRNANQINANLTPIENAMITARGVPTPKQLEAAYTNNTKKFGGRAAAARGDKVPDVVRLSVNNAPNIGNSGTADRLAGIMPFLLPTALGGSAVGLETFTDSPFLTGSLATLAALSTRTGQKTTQAALTKRPKALRRFGGFFGRRETQKGLAGMVTAPLLIEE